MTGRWFLSPTILSRPTNIQVALGLTVPIGGGVTNVITDERNFASGTVDPLVNATLAVGIVPGWSVATKFLTRQVVAETGNQKTGDYFSASLQVDYAPLGRDFGIYTGFLSIMREQDELNDVPFANSGGDWIYAIVGGSKAIAGAGESAIRVWGEFQWPVYLYVNGFQLTEPWNIRIGMNFAISILGHDERDTGSPLSIPDDSS